MFSIFTKRFCCPCVEECLLFLLEECLLFLVEGFVILVERFLLLLVEGFAMLVEECLLSLLKGFVVYMLKGFCYHCCGGLSCEVVVVSFEKIYLSKLVVVEFFSINCG